MTATLLTAQITKPKWWYILMVLASIMAIIVFSILFVERKIASLTKRLLKAPVQVAKRTSKKRKKTSSNKQKTDEKK
jgi:hypothetical protein